MCGNRQMLESVCCAMLTYRFTNKIHYVSKLEQEIKMNCNITLVHLH